MMRTLLFLLAGLCSLSLAQAQISTFPYSQGFDSTHDFTLSGVVDIWDADTLSDSGFYTAYAGVGALGTNLAGNYSAGDTSYATSPVFDFSGLTSDPYLSFQMKYAFEQGGFFGSNGYLRMELSLDGGANWTDLGTTLSGANEYALNWYDQFGPYSWTDDRLDYLPTRHELTGAAGQSAVQFRFVFESDNGSTTDHGVLIDELLVDLRPAQDVEMRSWSLQNPNLFSLGANEGINLTIANLGHDTLYTIPFAYQVFGPTDTTLYEDTIQTSFGLDPGGFISSFSSSVDLSDKGQYTILAYTRLANDAFRGDDTLTVSVTHRSPAAVTLPYSEGFELVNSNALRYTDAMEIDGVAGGFYDGDIDDGVLFFDGDSATEGARAACFTSEAFGGSQYLELTLDLSALDASSDVLNLTFDYLDDDNTSAFDDDVSVRGSNTGSYVELLDWQASGATGWQSSGSLDLAAALDNDGQNFSSTTQLRFRQGGLSNFVGETVCFDNLQLAGINVNAGVTDIAINSDVFNRSATDSVTVSVVVNGSQAIDTLTVELTVTDTIAITQSFTDTLVGSFQDTTLLVVFPGIDLSASDFYNVSAEALTTGDEKPGDNTQIVRLTTLRAAVLPYAEDFETALDATYTASGVLFDATSLYYQSEGSDGRLQVNPAGYLGSDAGKAAFMSSDDYNVNELILMVDASGVTTADSMVLSFALREYGDETDAEDKVYVRGSLSDPWVSILDWNNEGIDGLWRIFTIDFSAALSGAGQGFSATTQVKFSQNDNFPLPDDGLGVDQIEVFEVSNNDLAFISVDVPGGFGLTDSVSGTVQVTNLGDDSVASYEVNVSVAGPSSTQSYVFPIATAIAPDDTVSVVISGLDLSEVGNYELTASLAGLADVDSSNNAVVGYTTHRGVIPSLPFVADFDDQADTSFSESVSLYTGVYWEPLDSGATLATNYNDFLTHLGGTEAAYLGGEGANELIFTADLSEKDVDTDPVYLNFYYQSFFGAPDENDGVFVRGSQADPWIYLASWSSYPGVFSLGVTEVNDSLAKYNQNFSATTQVKFAQLETTNGSIIMLDQIVLNDQLVDLRDIGVSAETNYNVFDEISVRHSMKNEGNVGVDSVTLQVTIVNREDANDVEVVSDRFFIDLDPGLSTTVTLGPLPIKAAGGYDVTSVLVVENETNPFNNGYPFSRRFFGVDLEELPYTYGFEGSEVYPGGWEIGEPQDSLLATAFDGQNVLSTNLDGDLSLFTTSFAVSPMFDLSEYSIDPLVSFVTQYEVESGVGEFYLEMRKGDGAWVKLGRTTSDSVAQQASNWYNTPGDYWSGSSNGWVEVQHTAEGAAGNSRVQFRWVAFGGTNAGFEGVSVDNFQITPSTLPDLGLYTAQANPLLTFDTSQTTVEVTVGVVNGGGEDVASYAIHVIEPEGAIISESVTDTLVRLDSVTVPIAGVGLADTLRTIKVALDGAVDNFPDNDTLEYQLFSRTPAPIPFQWDFEGNSTSWVSTQPVPDMPNGWVVGDEFADFRITNTSSETLALYLESEGYFAMALDLSQQTTDDAVYLTFDWNHTQVGGAGDLGRNGLYVKGSPDQDWVLVANYDDISHTQSGSLLSGSINLSPALKDAGQAYTEATQVRFQWTSGLFDNLLVLDNIRVEAPQIDFAVTEITVPQASSQLSDNESVQLRIQNIGTDTDSTVQVTVTVTNDLGEEQSVSQTQNGPFVQGEEREVTLSGLDLSNYSDYQVVGKVLANGDEITDNDSLMDQTRTLRVVDTYPFNEGFENGRGGFYTLEEETQENWQWGEPSGLVITQAASGELAWVTNLEHDFTAETDAYLYAPILDMSSLDKDPVLSFLLQTDLVSPNYLSVEVSVDSGATWEVLGTRSEDNDADTSLINNWEEDGTWSDLFAEPVLASYPLNGLAGEDDLRIRFHVANSQSPFEEGVMIDAFQIATTVNQFPVLLTALEDLLVASDFGTETVYFGGTFEDPEGDTLTYSLEIADSTIITGELTNDSTLVLTQQGGGTTDVTLTATDPEGAAVSTTFLFTVNETPQVVNPIPDSSLNEGFIWTLDLTQVFQDTDSLQYGVFPSPDSSVAYLTYLGGGAAEVVDGMSGGSVSLEVFAVDPLGDTTRESFQVMVNAAPVAVATLGDTVLTVGFGSFQLDLSQYIVDPEGSPLLYFATSSVEEVVTLDVFSLTEYTFEERGEGTSVIEIQATDTLGATSTFTFNFTIASPPTVSPAFSELWYPVGFGSASRSLGDIFDAEFATYTYAVSADPDSVVGVSVTEGDSLLFEEIGKAFRTRITVTATNSFGLQASYSFPLRLNSPPEVPQLAYVRVDTSGTGPWLVDLDTVFTDAQGDFLTYDVQVTNPSVVTASFETVSPILTLTEVGIGTTEIRIAALDTLSTSDTVTLQFIVVAPEVVGLEELTTWVNVYPVPATDQVSVRMDLVRSAEVVVILTDLQGREVYRQEIGTTAQVAHTIPLQQTASGTWYLTVLLDGQPYTWPVIKR